MRPPSKRSGCCFTCRRCWKAWFVTCKTLVLTVVCYLPPDSLLQGAKRPRKVPDTESEDEEVEDEPGLSEYESAAQECITFHLGEQGGIPYISSTCYVPSRCLYRVSAPFYVHVVHSQEDLKLAEDGQDTSLSFQPEFTHQIFGEDETIYGYKELQVCDFGRSSLPVEPTRVLQGIVRSLQPGSAILNGFT